MAGGIEIRYFGCFQQRKVEKNKESDKSE